MAAEADVEQQAQQLIDRVIKASLEHFLKYQSNEIKGIEEKENISWPKSKGFTSEIGLQSIDTFVQEWSVSNKWKYCIDLLGQDDQSYKYRVVWSIPTRRKPVPRATASVFFTLVPFESYPVLVFYVFEGQRLVHRPGQSKFREDWLQDILDRKTIVLASVSLGL